VTTTEASSADADTAVNLTLSGCSQLRLPVPSSSSSAAIAAILVVTASPVDDMSATALHSIPVYLVASASAGLVAGGVNSDTTTQCPGRFDRVHLLNSTQIDTAAEVSSATDAGNSGGAAKALLVLVFVACLVLGALLSSRISARLAHFIGRGGHSDSSHSSNRVSSSSEVVAAPAVADTSAVDGDAIGVGGDGGSSVSTAGGTASAELARSAQATTASVASSASPSSPVAIQMGRIDRLSGHDPAGPSGGDTTDTDADGVVYGGGRMGANETGVGTPTIVGRIGAGFERVRSVVLGGKRSGSVRRSALASDEGEEDAYEE
jgi:hypothetical protein